MEKRILVQEAATKDLYGEESGFFVAEIKTGTGKTKILLDLAFRYIQDGKNVVISTSNNYLAHSFWGEAKKFNHDTEAMHLIVGRNNYIDTSLALSPGFLAFYGLTPREVNEWIGKNERMLLVDLFLRDFNLPDEARGEVALVDTDQKSLSGRLSRITSDRGEPGVFVTNHHYLIYLLRYAEREDIPIGENVVFLFDEAHQIDEAARSVFSKTFSMNFLRIGLRRLLETDGISKAMARRVRKAIVGVSDEMDAVRLDFDSAGEIVGTPPAVAKRVRELLGSEDFATIYRFAVKNKLTTGTMFLNEFLEARSIFGAPSGAARSSETVGLSLSAIKRYPSFILETENRTLGLRSIMSHPVSRMIFVSGTIRISPDEDVISNEWSFVKMGLLRFRNPKKGSKEEAFNRRIDCLRFFNYPYIFSRENLRFVCAKSDSLLPPRGDFSGGGGLKKKNEERSVSYRLWVKRLAAYLEERLWGNTVCLMSSFENSAMMAEELESLLGDEYRIILHRKGKTMTRTIEEYREAIDRGEKAILIGGMPFYTGIDLYGKYLNTLFIGKLPIEPKPTLIKRTLNILPSLQRDIRNKSLITFRQGVGRAKRREEDMVLLIVADPRIHTARYSNFKMFLDEVGIEIDED